MTTIIMMIRKVEHVITQILTRITTLQRKTAKLQDTNGMKVQTMRAESVITQPHTWITTLQRRTAKQQATCGRKRITILKSTLISWHTHLHSLKKKTIPMTPRPMKKKIITNLAMLFFTSKKRETMDLQYQKM